MTIAQDAAFLAHHDDVVLRNVGGGPPSGTAATKSSLHHQHLLQVQCDELLAASMSSSSSMMDEASSSSLLPPKRVRKWQQKLADVLSVSSADDGDDSYTLEWDNAGGALLKTAANANVPPTYAGYIVLDVPWRSSSSEIQIDYKNHGYFVHRQAVLQNVAARLLMNSSLLRLSNQETKENKKKKNKKSKTERRDQRDDHIIDTEDTAQLHWRRSLHHPTRKTVLWLTVMSSSSPKKIFRLQIDVRLRSKHTIHSWIPPIRFVPNRSNLSRSHESIQYSHAIFEDVAWIDVSSDLFDRYGSNAIKALALLQIWALQRGVWRSGLLDSLDAAATLLYLYRTKRVGPRNTPLQVLTHVWNFWCGGHSSDHNKHISTTKEEESSTGRRRCHVIPDVDKSEQQTIADCDLANLYAQLTRDTPLTKNDDPPTVVMCWQRAAPLSLLDPSMRHNYYAHYAPGDVATLRVLADESLRALQQQPHHQAAFRTLFLTHDRFYTRYDVYLTVHNVDDADDGEKIAIANAKNNTAAASAIDPHDRPRHVRDTIYTKLRQALGDRVSEIRFWSCGNGDTSQRHHHQSTNNMTDSDEIPSYDIATFPTRLSQLLQHEQRQPPLIIGFNVNADTCFRLVDRGPDAQTATNEAAVLAFRALWGHRAELRRFQDGAIVDAVVWGDDDDRSASSSRRRMANAHHWQAGLVSRIARHILQTHFLSSQNKNKSISQPNTTTNKSRQKKTKNKKNEKIDDDAAGATAAVDAKCELDGRMATPALDEMVSLVDGIPASSASNTIDTLINNPMEAHRAILKAYEELAALLRAKTAKTIPDGNNSQELRSQLGLPLAIDAVEALDPSLRYSSVYPPLPHLLLGAGQKWTTQSKKVAGAIVFDPIRIQIRFAVSTKGPTELPAIQAAERAMLIALVNGLDELDAFPHKSVVTESYADVCFQGYVWRITVRPDQAIHYLRTLQDPTAAARQLLADLEVGHVVSPKHHTLVHAVFTKHSSSSAVVRLAKRWLSAHLLVIPFEAIELMVCHVYCSTLNPPCTVTRGFERWLSLLANYDWVREALIVDPQGHLSDDEMTAIETQFQALRGHNLEVGPPMCIFSPSNKPDMLEDRTSCWTPSFVDATNPEKVILCRAVALARRSHTFLCNLLVAQVSTNGSNDKMAHKQNWTALFLESNDAFLSFSALLRLHPDFVSNPDASSTAKTLGISEPAGTNGSGPASAVTNFSRSMKALTDGPKVLRRTMYKNLIEARSRDMLLNWQPVRSAMKVLHSTSLTEHALFLYNDLCPEVIAIVWRKHERRPFSAITSEYAQPVSFDGWQSDTLVVLNVHDVVRGAKSVMANMISGVKLFDSGPTIEAAAVPRGKAHRAVEANEKRKRSSSIVDEKEDADSGSEIGESSSDNGHSN